LPIHNRIKEGNLFIAAANTMLSKNKELNIIIQQFTKLLQAKLPTININNKLQ